MMEEKKMSLTPEKIEEILDRLTQLMEQENALLSRMEVGSIGSFQEEKGKLMLSLEGVQQQLMSKPELKQAFSEVAKRRLKTKEQRMKSVMQLNIARIRAAQRVNECVIAAFREAITEKIGTASYGRKGFGHYDARVPAMKVNEVI